MRRAVAFIRAQGPGQFTRCVLCKLFYRVLQQIYGFDIWHASAPFPCREYKKRIVDLVTSFGPAVVADLGCGLGEIIARVPAVRRYGIDPSATAIKAARRLHGRHTTFLVGRLEDATAMKAAIPEAQIDLLIMTNWTHGYPIEALRSGLAALNALLPVRAILIDTMHADVRPGHYQAHTVESLSRIGCIVTTMPGDEVRDLHIIQLPR